MQQVFVVGDEPVPGYRLTADLGGSAFYKMWKVTAPDGSSKLWKVIDLVVGNAAIETRTLGLLVQLRHPYLNTLTNFWQLDDGKTLIVETDVPLFSLREHLDALKQRGESMPREEILAYIEQAAEGLDFLNSPRHDFQGSKVAIYHRALRPECLLVFDDGGNKVCKVSDFGLSKPVTEEVAQHSQGLLHYDYDPPEFFEGQTSSTSDQYALAINYFEMRTGNLPFSGTMLQQLQARLSDSPTLTNLPETERPAVKRALSRDPSARFENCVAFARALRSGGLESQALPTAARLSAGLGASTAATAASRIPTPASRSGSLASFGISPATRAVGTPNLRMAAATSPTATEAPAPSAPAPLPGVVYNRPPSSGLLRPLAATAAVPEPTTETVPAPRLPKDLSKTNLKMLRMQTTGGQTAAQREDTIDFSMDGERKIPVLWVVVILVVVLGMVYAGLSLLPI